MVNTTLLLVAVALILVGANAILSRLPRKGGTEVKVAFLPPSAAPSVPAERDPMLEAHMQSTHQKFSLLFSRVEELEKSMAKLLTHDEQPVQEATWIETVPVRKRKAVRKRA